MASLSFNRCFLWAILCTERQNPDGNVSFRRRLSPPRCPRGRTAGIVEDGRGKALRVAFWVGARKHRQRQKRVLLCLREIYLFNSSAKIDGTTRADGSWFLSSPPRDFSDNSLYYIFPLCTTYSCYIQDIFHIEVCCTSTSRGCIRRRVVTRGGEPSIVTPRCFGLALTNMGRGEDFIHFCL